MKYDYQRIKWRVLISAVVAYVVVVGVWIPMKIRGALAPHMDWFHVLVLPAMGLSVLARAHVLEARRRDGLDKPRTSTDRPGGNGLVIPTRLGAGRPLNADPLRRFAEAGLARDGQDHADRLGEGPVSPRLLIQRPT
jgi:hypothetical protein